MSSSYDVAILAVDLAAIVGYGYVTYTALAIRRTIAARVYRHQALGIALIAILYGLNTIIPNYPSATVDIYFFLTTLPFLLAFDTIFYWVDTSVLAARLTDPLLRDTLHWSRVRLVIWAVNISASVVAISYPVYLQLVTGGIPPNPTPIQLVLFLTPAYISVGSGAVALYVVVRRTADRTLRRHLEWFGLYLIFILVFAGLIGNGLMVYSVEWSNLVGGAANAAGSYFLYRSAKSLIPIYRFSEEEARQAAPSKLEAM